MVDEVAASLLLVQEKILFPQLRLHESLAPFLAYQMHCPLVAIWQESSNGFEPVFLSRARIPTNSSKDGNKTSEMGMSELLPDNLELARRSADSCVATSCATVKSPKKRIVGGLERANCLVGVF